LEAAVPSIEQMDISGEAKEKILGKNVERLLKLNS
jgi:predicted TIM-barrel fold metal-dependent hydrolase